MNLAGKGGGIPLTGAAFFYDLTDLVRLGGGVAAAKRGNGNVRWVVVLATTCRVQSS